MIEKNNDTKRDASKSNVVTRFISVIVILIVLCFIGVMIYVALTPHSALNIKRSKGQNSVISFVDASNSAKKTWFSSTQEAIMSVEDWEKIEYLSEPILEQQSDDYLYEVNYCQMNDNGALVVGFIISRYEINGELYSTPSTPMLFVHADLTNKIDLYTYEAESIRVAEYLTDTLSPSSESIYSGYPHAGVSLYPEIKTLTILGMSPTGIIEYEHGGITYYFWYYDYDFSKYLNSHGDFSYEDFTLAELIEILEIKVDEPK